MKAAIHSLIRTPFAVSFARNAIFRWIYASSTMYTLYIMRTHSDGPSRCSAPSSVSLAYVSSWPAVASSCSRLIWATALPAPTDETPCSIPAPAQLSATHQMQSEATGDWGLRAAANYKVVTALVGHGPAAASRARRSSPPGPQPVARPAAPNRAPWAAAGRTLREPIVRARTPCARDAR